MLNDIKVGWRTFRSIFKGMGITFGHLFSPSVTLQYPEERMELPKGARARLYVNIDDCIGCNLCARACPVNCIDIETVPSTADVDLGVTSTGNPKRFWLTRFNIDMAKCMYCDLCVHPCPTDCIYMVPEYEYSEFDRTNLVYHFSNLKPDMVASVKVKAEIEAEEKLKQKEELARQKAELAKKKAEEQAEEAKPKSDEPAAGDPGKDIKPETKPVSDESDKDESKPETKTEGAEPAADETGKEGIKPETKPESDEPAANDSDKEGIKPEAKPDNSDADSDESSKKENGE